MSGDVLVLATDVSSDFGSFSSLELFSHSLNSSSSSRGESTGSTERTIYSSPVVSFHFICVGIKFIFMRVDVSPDFAVVKCFVGEVGTWNHSNLNLQEALE